MRYSLSYQKLFYYTLLLSLSLSLLDIKGTLYIPFKNLFELLLILGAIISFRMINKHIVVFAIFSLVYILFNFFLGIYSGDSLVDLTIAYKSFIYIIMCTFFVKSNIFDKSTIRKLFYIVTIVFIVKYTVSVLFKFAPATNGVFRPTVFYENNFELTFVLLLWATKVWIENYNIDKWDFCVVVAITLLSFSRVTLLEFLFILSMLFFRKKDNMMVKTLIFSTLFCICVYVFLSRDVDITQIDRYKLFMNFLYEVRNWNLLDWLLGSDGALHTLSTKTCSLNSFYIYQFNMESHSHYGECYSNIFHSFDLRVIFDHGVLGLIFILYSYFCMLRKSGVGKYFCFVILGVILINGLSVSGFNNIFAIIGIMLVLGLRKNEYIEITRS